MMLIFYCVLFSFLFSDNLVEVGGVVYTDVDFFQTYSRVDWERSSDQQKAEMLDDYVKHLVVEKEATSLGFLYRPDIAVKYKNRCDMAMVNSVYEELVAKPLVNDVDLQLALQNIKQEVLVSHILIGYNDSRLQQKPNRTKDEAFLLAQKINKDLKNGVDFISLAVKYSDDPGVGNNSGSLGWLSWGKTIQPFQVVAFGLHKGGFSRPVLTDFGYHIILANDIRFPDFMSRVSDGQLEFDAYNSCKVGIQHLLRPAAQAFDSLQLEKNKIIFNNNAINKIVGYVVEKEKDIKLSNRYNFDLVDFLLELNSVGVVCVYNGGGLGLRWFAEQLRRIPVSRRPRLGGYESIINVFKTILLQDNARSLGLKNNITSIYHYNKTINSIKKSLLYDSYFKWVVNSARKPDSTDVVAYYNDNKLTKYREPKKVSVREIRVISKSLADSIRLELNYGVGFELLAREFSKTNPHDGGLIKPFDETKYNDMGAQAFLLSPGEVSGVIENLDHSYSIIKVEGFVPEQTSQLSAVYVRIESLLSKEFQNKSKVDIVDSLYVKYSVAVLGGY